MSTIEFDSRFEEMSTLLHSFAYNLTKNVEEAKDLYQETAYRAMTNREKFRPGTNFKAWLFTIMKNIFINNYRKKVKANTIMDSTDNLYYINNENSITFNDASSNFVIDDAKKAINELSDDYKIPFMMHYEGYKYQEIADELDISINTSKSQLIQARKRLKEYLKELNYPGIKERE